MKQRLIWYIEADLAEVCTL